MKNLFTLETVVKSSRDGRYAHIRYVLHGTLHETIKDMATNCVVVAGRNICQEFMKHYDSGLPPEPIGR